MNATVSLLVKYEKKTYRIEVFMNSVGIQDQFADAPILLSKKAFPLEAGQLYNPQTGVVDYHALGRLLKRYPDFRRGHHE